MTNALFLIALFMTCQPFQHTSKDSPDQIVFVGVLQQIAPDTGILSGDLAIYRLAKYKVEHVCKGEYNEKEVVVDHLIVTGKELEGVNVGDRVLVPVTKSKTVLARFNSDGIRKPSDVVKAFLVGGKVTSCCQARDRECCSTTQR